MLLQSAFRRFSNVRFSGRSVDVSAMWLSVVNFLPPKFWRATFMSADRTRFPSTSQVLLEVVLPSKSRSDFYNFMKNEVGYYFKDLWGLFRTRNIKAGDHLSDACCNIVLKNDYIMKRSILNRIAPIVAVLVTRSEPETALDV